MPGCKLRRGEEGVREDGNFENRRAKRCFDADRYLKGLSNRRPRLIVHRWRIWFCLFFRRSLDFAPPFLFFFFCLALLLSADDCDLDLFGERKEISSISV